MNSISSTYRNQIADATWYVNGYNTINATPATWYAAESTGTTWTGKIGLMYVSDYGFAANPSSWTTYIGSYRSSSITSNNWMYIGAREWTISYESTFSNGVFSISQTGAISQDLPYNISLSTRPAFYLNSNVAYAGGTGTQNDPYIIGM